MAAPPLLLRSRVSSRHISTALRCPFSKKAIGFEAPPLAPTSRRVSRIQRLPAISGALMSMLPLHSAIASARLTSILSAQSQSWGLIPQGISMPL
ncbi:uncharacterized protein LOC109709826 [Ananas comosus]|uniref:Uncharacterized protein LOC109709826 n=1 Tax=Ananas comosus TaxID=4615 RepID=A0A6P5F2P1_ANACO|nr:uncharacterized protein LOC109709826 [Ananas comosus]